MTALPVSREMKIPFSTGTVYAALTAPVSGQEFDDLLNCLARLVHTELIPMINRLEETADEVSSARLCKAYDTKSGGQLSLQVRVVSIRKVDFHRLTSALEHAFIEAHALVDLVDNPITGKESDAIRGLSDLLAGMTDDLFGSPLGTESFGGSLLDGLLGAPKTGLFADLRREFGKRDFGPTDGFGGLLGGLGKN